MSATRRDLFKTSVVSAVGVASIGLLSGCQTWPPPTVPGAVPAVGKDDASPQWYVFITTNTATTVYAAGLPPCSLTPFTCPFDTATYVQQLINANKFPLATSKNFSIGGYPFGTDQNGNLLPGSNFNPTPKTFSWNEIGST